MKIIDLETYPRRSHYEFFKSYAYPYMGITANVDVTNLYNAAKNLGGSPFLAFLWAAATAANDVPELRQRIVNDQIVEYDHCNTAHTVALPDGTFVNCQTDCRRSFAGFLAYGKQCQEEAKKRHGFVQPGDDETRLIFVSSTPWVTFTQVIQPTPIPADSNVRIVFGKFFEQDGRKLMPLAIQVNHALVDGLHVGRFYQRFQELADSDLMKEFRAGYDPSMDYGKYPTFVPLKNGTPSGKQRPVSIQKTPTPATEQKAEKNQPPVPAPENAAWKNNVLQRDEPQCDVFKHDAMKAYPVFCSKYQRKQIASVTFLDSLRELPLDAWDVSAMGNRSVMAWVKPNGKLYDLYIGAEGGVCTGVSCQKLFAGYINVKRITFCGALHTEDAENMSYMFNDCCSLTELDLSSFDTSKVQDMSGMFEECRSLTELDLNSFDTSKVQDMSGMFYFCHALTKLDLSSFNTSKVRYMSWMFEECRSLTELDLSSFNTSNVQNMRGMFEECRSLTELDLSSFDTSKVQDMSLMFYFCHALTKLDLSSFNTSKVQDMSGMFEECRSLTELDLSSFDTSKVQDMSRMFYLCRSLTKLDLRRFDTYNVQSMSGMFSYCPAGSRWKHLLH